MKSWNYIWMSKLKPQIYFCIRLKFHRNHNSAFGSVHSPRNLNVNKVPKHLGCAPACWTSWVDLYCQRRWYICRLQKVVGWPAWTLYPPVELLVLLMDVLLVILLTLVALVMFPSCSRMMPRSFLTLPPSSSATDSLLYSFCSSVPVKIGVFFTDSAYNGLV